MDNSNHKIYRIKTGDFYVIPYPTRLAEGKGKYATEMDKLKTSGNRQGKDKESRPSEICGKDRTNRRPTKKMHRIKPVIFIVMGLRESKGK